MPKNSTNDYSMRVGLNKDGSIRSMFIEGSKPETQFNLEEYEKYAIPVAKFLTKALEDKFKNGLYMNEDYDKFSSTIQTLAIIYSGISQISVNMLKKGLPVAMPNPEWFENLPEDKDFAQTFIDVVTTTTRINMNTIEEYEEKNNNDEFTNVISQIKTKQAKQQNRYKN